MSEEDADSQHPLRDRPPPLHAYEIARAPTNNRRDGQTAGTKKATTLEDDTDDVPIDRLQAAKLAFRSSQDLPGNNTTTNNAGGSPSEEIEDILNDPNNNDWMSKGGDLKKNPIMAPAEENNPRQLQEPSYIRYISDSLSSTAQNETNIAEEEPRNPVVPTVSLQRSQRIRPQSQPGAVSVTPSGTSGGYGEETEEQVPEDEGEYLIHATLVGSQTGVDDSTESQRNLLEEETRRRMMDQVVDADAIPLVQDPVEMKVQYRRRVGLVIVVSILLLIGVILAAVFGRATPTVVTPAPTQSAMPSQTPSSLPTTSSQPSGSPTSPPSVSPSAFPTQPPDNRFCSDAQELQLNVPVLIDSLSGVRVDENGTVLDENEAITSKVDSCHGVPPYMEIGIYTNTTRWFRMVGIGPVTLTTCDDFTLADTDLQGKGGLGDCSGSTPLTKYHAPSYCLSSCLC